MSAQVSAVTAASLPAVLRARAARHPDRLFLTDIGGADWTYAELAHLAEVWARRWLDLSVTRGDRVGLLAPAGAQELAAWLGLARVGGVGVAVNPAYRGDLLRHALDLAGVRAVLVDADGLAAVLQVADRIPSLTDAVVLTPAAKPTAENRIRVHVADALSDRPADPDDVRDPNGHEIATVLYTSGTTGLPKGVLVPWAQLMATADAVLPNGWLSEDEALYSPYGPFHVSGRAPIAAMAARGLRVVVRPSFRTAEFWDDVNSHGCTLCLLVGSTVDFLLDNSPGENPNRSLRHANILPVGANTQRFAERFGIRVFTAFNMTEVSCPIVNDDLPAAPTSCGRVRPGYHARVVDEYDRPVSPGGTGELLIRADTPWTLSPGYLEDPVATATLWRNQWLHTGDLVRQDTDGRFYFLGRRSDTIRRRGENISAALVEQCLVADPDVLDCAVVGVAAATTEQEVFAFVVLRPDVRPSADRFAALAERLASDLPDFMIPRYWRSVDELPRTATAKVQKFRLRGIALDAPSWERPRRKDSTR